MKLDFSKINITNITEKQAIFFYGNFEAGTLVFWDKLLKTQNYLNTSSKTMNKFDSFKTITASEFIQTPPEPFDLFGSKTAYYIKDTKDTHLKAIQDFLVNAENIFCAFQAGDFRQSKKITDFFVKHPQYPAVASFNNQLGITSILNFYNKNINPKFFNKIFNIINSGTDSIISLLQKFEILESNENISQYITSISPKDEINSMEFIAIVRYLIFYLLKDPNEFSNFINELFFNNPNKNLRINLSDTAKFLTEIELEYKLSAITQPSVIYQKLLCGLCAKQIR